MNEKIPTLDGYRIPDEVRLLSDYECEVRGLSYLGSKRGFCAWAALKQTEEIGLLKRSDVRSVVRCLIVSDLTAAAGIVFPKHEGFFLQPLGAMRRLWAIFDRVCLRQMLREDRLKAPVAYSFSRVLGEDPQLLLYHKLGKPIKGPIRTCYIQHFSSLVPLAGYFNNFDVGDHNAVVVNHKSNETAKRPIVYSIDYDAAQFDKQELATSGYVVEGALTHSLRYLREYDLPFNFKTFKKSMNALTRLKPEQIHQSVCQAYAQVPCSLTNLFALSHRREVIRNLCQGLEVLPRFLSPAHVRKRAQEFNVRIVNG